MSSNLFTRPKKWSCRCFTDLHTKTCRSVLQTPGRWICFLPHAADLQLIWFKIVRHQKQEEIESGNFVLERDPGGPVSKGSCGNCAAVCSTRGARRPEAASSASAINHSERSCVLRFDLHPSRVQQHTRAEEWGGGGVHHIQRFIRCYFSTAELECLLLASLQTPRESCTSFLLWHFLPLEGSEQQKNEPHDALFQFCSVGVKACGNDESSKGKRARSPPRATWHHGAGHSSWLSLERRERTAAQKTAWKCAVYATYTRICWRADLWWAEGLEWTC